MEETWFISLDRYTATTQAYAEVPMSVLETANAIEKAYKDKEPKPILTIDRAGLGMILEAMLADKGLPVKAFKEKQNKRIGSATVFMSFDSTERE